MGYSLLGRVVNLTTHKELAYCDVSFLKYVGGNRSYSSEFDNIDADYTIGEEFNDLLFSRHNSYVGIYPKSVLELSDAFVPSKYKFGIKLDNRFVIEKDIFEKLELDEKSIEYADIQKINNGELNPDDYVQLSKTWTELDKGHWYTAESFSEYRETVKSRLDEEREKLRKLTELKFTKDYFEMSEKAKSELFDEISCSEEAIEEYEGDLQSLDKIIDILNFYEHDLFIKDENDEFTYYEHRKVAIYINAE